MDSILTSVGIAGPITYALIQMAKAQGLPSRFAPISSLLLGLIAVILLVAADVVAATYGQAALIGVLTGLSASGSYDVVTKTRPASK